MHTQILIMNPRDQPTFAFADSSPVRSGKKHRRGKGHTPNRKNTSASRSGSAGRSGSSSASSSQQEASNSYRQGGHKYSSAASSMSAQSQQQQHNGHQQKQKPQANYYTTDAWNSNPNNTSISSSKGGGNNNKDDNSCAGSLTYSASSSVQSAESSNDSSFADIIKLIDSEGEGATEIKDFIAKQSKAASGGERRGDRPHNVSGGFTAAGGGQYEGPRGDTKNAAVQGWMQRVEDRSRAQQAQKKQAKQQSSSSGSSRLQLKQKKNQYTMAAARQVPNPNVDLNYSKDDSSEDDVFGVDVDFDENVLETIAGLDDDGHVRQTSVKVSSQSNSAAMSFNDNQNPFRNQDPFHPSSPYSHTHPTNSKTLSAPSSPRSPGRSGHVTPPPNSRHKRTSTPPEAHNISRTGSRHSKSSSDGSWDTPAPASPPHGGTTSMVSTVGGAMVGSLMQGMSSAMKPPHHHHTRGTPTSKGSRRKSSPGGSRGDPGDGKMTEDLSEAFYAKSWMCGFTDAFNFDGFDKNFPEK